MKVTVFEAEHLDEDGFEQTWSWWNIGAAFGLIGGMIAICFGFGLTIVLWLESHNYSHISLQRVINLLFYSAFPLLFFGAYCLDKIDEIVKKKKRQNLLK